MTTEITTINTNDPSLNDYISHLSDQASRYNVAFNYLEARQIELCKANRDQIITAGEVWIGLEMERLKARRIINTGELPI